MKLICNQTVLIIIAFFPQVFKAKLELCIFETGIVMLNFYAAISSLSLALIHSSKLVETKTNSTPNRRLKTFSHP